MTEPTRAELLVAATMWAGGCDAPDFLATVNRILPEMAENPAAPSFADLLARARALLGDEWQPIETLVMDGRQVMMWSPLGGCFNAPAAIGRSLTHSEIVKRAKDGLPLPHKGWDSTHWRPLPAPPQGGDRG